MSRLASLHPRSDRRWAISRSLLVPIPVVLIAFSVASSMGRSAAGADQFQPAPHQPFESPTIGRLFANLSTPTVRVFVDAEDSLPLDISQLRTIEDNERSASIPAYEPQLRREAPQDGVSSLFAPPRGSEWIREKPADEPESRLFSLRDDGGVGLYPVRRLSIPNPLKYIGNPFQWGGRFRAEYGANFDDLHLLRGNLIVNSGIPVGFDTEFNYRNDDVRAHQLNDFWTGDFNVVYRFGQIRYAEIRAGVGINWLAGDGTTDFGFNATYGVDFHIKKPWIISTSFDWGTLASDALLHMRITGGLDLGRFELYLGYDFYEVGSREWKAVVAGVGMWF